ACTGRSDVFLRQTHRAADRSGPRCPLWNPTSLSCAPDAFRHCPFLFARQRVAWLSGANSFRINPRVASTIDAADSHSGVRLIQKNHGETLLSSHIVESIEPHHSGPL